MSMPKGISPLRNERINEISKKIIFIGLFLLVFVGVLYADDPNLVAHWTMDDNAPNTIVIDSSSNNNHGIFHDSNNPNTDVHHVTGEINGALAFDGIDDYVQIGSNNDEPLIQMGSSFTISALVKLNSTNGHKSLYGYYSTSTANYFAYWMEVYNGDFRLSIGNGSTLTTVTNLDNGSNLVAGAWYHLVTVFDGNSVKGYINGDLRKTAAIELSGDFPKAGPTGTLKEIIGGAYGGTSCNFDGYIDEVKVWKRALLDNEVEAISYDGGTINVKDAPYNAQGDGVTDDSNAIQNAINDASSAGRTILLEDGTFMVNKMINLIKYTTLLGKNGTLKNINRSETSQYADPMLRVGDDCTVDDLVIDGNNKSLVGIEIRDKKNVTIQNCIVQNLVADVDAVHGIWVRYDCNNINILSTTIRDINGCFIGCRGLMAGGTNSESTHMLIDDCNFINILGANPSTVDADAIHILGTRVDKNGDSDSNDNSDWTSFYATIQNCTFDNFCRRAIKLHCSDTIVRYNDINDSDCYHGIRAWGVGHDISSNTLHIGVRVGGIDLSCSNSIIEDNLIDVTATHAKNGYGMTLGDANNNATGNQIRTDRYALYLGEYTNNNNFIDNILDIIDIYHDVEDDSAPDSNNTTIPNTLPWDHDPNYVVGDKVLYDSNTVYDCIQDHSGQEPPNATYWDPNETVSWE